MFRRAAAGMWRACRRVAPRTSRPLRKTLTSGGAGSSNSTRSSSRSVSALHCVAPPRCLNELFVYQACNRRLSAEQHRVKTLSSKEQW